MKFSKSTYFSLFFLFCFTASFSANTWQNMQTAKHQLEVKNLKQLSVSNAESECNSDANLLFEENENETELSFIAQSFTLPFYISFFQCKVFTSIVLFAILLTQKSTNPIYIEVCNFRI